MIRVAFVGLLALVACGTVTEEPVGLPERSVALAVSPRPDDALIVKVTAETLGFLHYDGVEWNDDRSLEWFDSLLDVLDPSRVYLLAADHRELSETALALDDTLRADLPAVWPGFWVYDRYRSRLLARCEWVLERLSKPFDLTDAGELSTSREDARWFLDEAEADAYWERRLEGELIALLLGDLEQEAAVERLRSRYTRVRDDVAAADAGDVLELYLVALAQTFDPHTVYFGPKSKEDLDIQLSTSVEGIGAVLSTEGEYVRIVSVVPGGPAAKSGELAPDDRIVSVRGEGAEVVDVVGMRLDRVVQLIRGERGTRVTLTVIPAAAPTQRRTIELVRDRVPITAQDPKIEVREVTGQRVGVITVPAFIYAVDPETGDTKRTSDHVAMLLRDNAPLDAVLLDLRGNSGGVLDEAVALSGLFLDTGPIVQTRGQEGIEVLDDEQAGAAWTGPLVVLTSPMTASAAEILAAAVQDYGRGIIAGSRTHGKGTVQRVLPLGQLVRDVAGRAEIEGADGGLKLTTAKFYRVSGGSTQARGVEPDVPIPSPYEGVVSREQELERALPWDTIEPTAFAPLGRVDAIRADLKARSARRVAETKAFEALAETRRIRHRFDEQASVSLVLEERRAERAALDAKLEALEFSDDPVLEEGLAITADLLQNRR